MIQKKDILAFVHHIIRRQGGRSDKRLMHPEREWFTGLALMLIVGLCGSAYSAYFFFIQLNRVDTPIVVDTTAVYYQQSLVNDVLQTYRDRANTFNALRESDGVALPSQDQTSTATQDAYPSGGALRAQ